MMNATQRKSREVFKELILKELREKGSITRAKEVVHPAARAHAKQAASDRCNVDRLMAGRLIFQELVTNGQIVLRDGKYFPHDAEPKETKK